MRSKDLISLALILAVVLGFSAVTRGWQTRSDGAALREQVRAGDLLMLSSTTCVYCTQAREWLSAQRVPYRECFIETDRACAEAFRARGGLGTPTLVVRGQTVVGFDRTRLLALLEARR